MVRGSIILENGKNLFPPPPIATPPAHHQSPPKPEKAKEVQLVNPFTSTLKDSLVCTAGIGSILGLGVASPDANFTSMLTTLGLSGIVGYHTVWGVTPALHSPLMSVTNAISGITAVGGLLLMNGGYYPTNSVEALAATAAFVSFVNVFGGFIVTKRMLDMFIR